VGIPWICIGVGFSMPFFFKAVRMDLGNFISWKVLTGGGRLSPSTRMCHFLRTRSWYSGGRSRT
jgi:hypothetical protein